MAKCEHCETWKAFPGDHDHKTPYKTDFCPDCGEPITDRGREIQRERLEGVERAATFLGYAAERFKDFDKSNYPVRYVRESCEGLRGALDNFHDAVERQSNKGETDGEAK